MGWARELFAGKPAMAAPLLGSLHLDGTLEASCGFLGRLRTHAEHDLVSLFVVDGCDAYCYMPRVQSVRDGWHYSLESDG